MLPTTTIGFWLARMESLCCSKLIGHGCRLKESEPGRHQPTRRNRANIQVSEKMHARRGAPAKTVPHEDSPGSRDHRGSLSDGIRHSSPDEVRSRCNKIRYRAVHHRSHGRLCPCMQRQGALLYSPASPIAGYYQAAAALNVIHWQRKPLHLTRKRPRQHRPWRIAACHSLRQRRDRSP